MGLGEDDEALKPSWLEVPTVDMQGLFQTERDLATEGVTTKSRRHFNLDRPAPYLHGSLQPRDTHGTPAPHLAPPALRAAMRSAADAAAAITTARSGTDGGVSSTMWSPGAAGGAAAVDPAGALAAVEIQRGKRQNAILRRVVDKLSCRTRDAREVWLKLNNNHDGTCDPRELREGLSR
jgi:hypothetical protein